MRTASRTTSAPIPSPGSGLIENFSEETLNVIQSFGGNPHLNFVPYATHVVVNSSESPMAKEAEQYQGIFVINDSWWKLSYLSFIKIDEHIFAIPDYDTLSNAQQFLQDLTGPLLDC